MKVEWKNCLRVGISAFVLFLAIYYWKGLTGGLTLFLSAASPLLLGCMIAYILNIPMSFYERHLFPRAVGSGFQVVRRVICMIAAIVTVAGVMAGVVGLIIPELAECIELLISWIPGAIDWVVDIVSDSESLAEIIPPEYLATLEKMDSVDWESWITKIINFLYTGVGGAVGTAVGAITSVFSSVVTFVLGLIFALYLLIGKDRLVSQGNRLMKTYLPERVRNQISHVLSVLNDCFHRYVVGQCTEAVILGGLCIVGMMIFRFPYATMIGALVGFTALIPVAGAYIGAVVGAIMILTVSPIQAVFFVIFLTVLQQLEGNLIYPRVVGTSLGLPGMWVLAAVTVGGGLLGIPGMLIGVPLVGAVYRLLWEDVSEKESRERAALSRRVRERRNVKPLKGAHRMPKLDADSEVKLETAPKGKRKAENSKTENGKIENGKIEQSKVKNNKPGNGKTENRKLENNQQENNKAEVVNKSENKAGIPNTKLKQDMDMAGAETPASSGSHSRHRRRRRHKKSNSGQAAGE